MQTCKNQYERLRLKRSGVNGETPPTRQTRLALIYGGQEIPSRRLMAMIAER